MEIKNYTIEIGRALLKYQVARASDDKQASPCEANEAKSTDRVRTEDQNALHHVMVQSPTGYLRRDRTCDFKVHHNKRERRKGSN